MLQCVWKCIWNFYCVIVSIYFYISYIYAILIPALCHFVNSSLQTGNLSGSSIFVIYSLGSSFIQGRDSSFQSSFCSFLIFGIDCCVYFLNHGLYFRFDCFVSCSSGLSYQDSFFCGFDISQFRAPPKLLYIPDKYAGNL